MVFEKIWKWLEFDSETWELKVEWMEEIIKTIPVSDAVLEWAKEYWSLMEWKK